jgi:hypothetical protein
MQNMSSQRKRKIAPSATTSRRRDGKESENGGELKKLPTRKKELKMFDLQTTGLMEAQRKIQSVVTRASNLAPIAPAVYEAVQKDVAQRFASSPGVGATATVYGGVEWQALSEAYIKSAKREGGTQLKITGDLERQFQKGEPGNVAEATANSITFGAESAKAKGVDSRRQLLPAHPQLVQDVNQILAGYITAE